MKIIDQIRDDYGNLLQLWGVYEQTDQTLLEEGRTYPVKKIKRKLLHTFENLSQANSYLQKILTNSKE